MSPEQLVKLVDEISSASEAAQKYGPFYFALFLLLIVPFIAGSIVKRAADKASDATARAAILKNYDIYFRACLGIGALCAVSGVGWWFYQNYRFDSNIDSTLAKLRSEVSDLRSRAADMRYTAVGYIQNETDLKNEFLNTLGRPSVVFSREGGPDNTWIFSVISDQPILASQPIPIILAYTVPTTGEKIFWHLNMPLQSSASPLAYRFTVDQGGAHIQLQN